MKKIVFLILTMISLVCIISGIILYNHNDDKITGLFVRKMYGSLGNLGDNNASVIYEVFNFNNVDMTFLNEKDYINLDNEDIKIEKINITKQNSVNELTIYNMQIVMSFEQIGNMDFTRLEYKKDDQEIIMELGNLTIVNMEYERSSLKYSCFTNFYSNETSLFISENNEESFSVEEIIYYNPNIKNLTYDKSIECIKGEETEIKIIIEYDINEFDNLILLPIIKLKKSNNEFSYFTPASYISTYEPMTYVEIKEYVK